MCQVPTEGHAAELRIHENRAVTVVPGQAEQTSLPRPEVFEPLRKLRDAFAGAPGNGIEDIARGGKPRFDAGFLRMHRTRHDAADSGDEPGIVAHGDDASGSADYVDDVTGARTSADCVPVCVKCADRDGDSGL